MKFLHEIKKNYMLYLLLLPGLICIVLFSYLPMSGHLLAFKKFTVDGGIFHSPWSGFSNFTFFFSSGEWKRIIGNTIYLNVLFIFFTQFFAVFLAVMINEVRNTFIKRVSQSLVFLPYFVSWLVVSLMLQALLNGSDGLINQSILKPLGFKKYPFFMKPQIWPAILTISNVWKFVGYYSVIYISAIIGVSPDLYDAARVDGASKWQEMFYVTLPQIRPTILIMLLLAIGRIFYGDFGMIYGIIGDNGVLFPTTDVIDTYTYRALRQFGNFGQSSAVNLVQSALGLATILVFNKIVRRIDPDASLF
ncbi:MAG: ABC transporter permease subunit [Clostridiales bacterium]|nr:ABC transporter permease subunit [Clostridiales bacterium]MDO4349377.1 ABC transporter permease subunit [Eubacteriales bacterium]MDY4008212.1 ABC transporter permease subunit [Candidatus Limiplasma sp.]